VGIMDIQPTEWSRAQELLVRLVQVLTPIVQQGSGEGISSFSRSLFVPPEPLATFPFSVRLLKVLTQAQSQMSQWIEEAKEESAPQQKSPLVPAPSPKREVPFAPIFSQKPAQGRAKELIIQVRQAIRTLATFSTVENPKPPPFREVMRKLKPLIDDLIETVGKTDMHSSDDWASPNRKAVPIPARQEQIFPKRIPLPFRGNSGRDNAPKKEPSSPPIQKRGEKPWKEEVRLTPQATPRARAITPEPSLPVTSLRPGPSQSEERKPSVSAPHFDRISLPGVPYFHPSPSHTPVKGKKKKKDFLHREDEDEDEKSD
jgi:hypothetical protein